MVRMSTVWDRTTQVLSGRFGMLAAIAALLQVVPTTVQQGAMLGFAGETGAAVTPAAALAEMSGVFALVVPLVLVCAVWNGLALIAAASDPNVHTVGEALGRGLRRLPLAIGLTLLIGVLFVLVVFVPVVAILVAGGFSLSAMRNPSPAVLSGVGAGAALGVLLFFLVALVAFIWVAARLFLLNPVIVNERRGVGSIARAWRLTRGLALKLVGVLILFGLIAVVLAAAVQSVVGVLLALVLGAGSTGALVGAALGGALINAGFAIVISAFMAQLYDMLTGREAARAFE